MNPINGGGVTPSPAPQITCHRPCCDSQRVMVELERFLSKAREVAMGERWQGFDHVTAEDLHDRLVRSLARVDYEG